MSAKLIIVFTVTGNTARMLSKYKPQQPILCVVCPTESAAEFGTLRPQRSSSSGQLDAAVGGLRKVPSMAAFKTGSMGKSASIVARQCLSMRGVIPILADPDLE
ncbi:hypothetical protein FOA52_006349 [Chlamydomonas sp. UWO 241]|nr:hypothetical protein FOA52_006349 [Chlamydomonas sp. UWO 241]